MLHEVAGEEEEQHAEEKVYHDVHTALKHQDFLIVPQKHINYISFAEENPARFNSVFNKTGNYADHKVDTEHNANRAEDLVFANDDAKSIAK